MVSKASQFRYKCSQITVINRLISKMWEKLRHFKARGKWGSNATFYPFTQPQMSKDPLQCPKTFSTFCLFVNYPHTFEVCVEFFVSYFESEGLLYLYSLTRGTGHRFSSLLTCKVQFLFVNFFEIKLHFFPSSKPKQKAFVFWLSNLCFCFYFY